MKKTVNMTTEMHRKLPLRCEKSKKNYEQELPRSLPIHLSPHPTLHLIPHPSVYTIAENSTQDVSKCTVFRSEVKKIFWGGGKAPSPDPSLSGEGDTPSPHPTPLASTLLLCSDNLSLFYPLTIIKLNNFRKSSYKQAICKIMASPPIVYKLRSPHDLSLSILFSIGLVTDQ